MWATYIFLTFLVAILQKQEETGEINMNILFSLIYLKCYLINNKLLMK